MNPSESGNLLSILDWAILLVYMVGVTWLGSHLAKRQTSTSHYFVAEGRLPSWAVGISMFATLLSSATFISSPGWAYDNDWQVIARDCLTPFAILFCALLIIPIYRNVIRISAYEYLQIRFGYAGRLYGTLGFLLGHFFKVGVVLFAMCVALHSLTGWPIQALILITGLVATIFTFFGGIEGVVWTDVAQGLIMLAAGLITIFYLVYWLTPDAPFAAVESAWRGGKFHAVDLALDPKGETFWVFVWLGFFHMLTKYATDQTMVQRYLLASSVKEAARATIIGYACVMLTLAIFYGIGSLLWGFYDLYPERLGAHITEGDKVFPFFIGSELPIGITGLVLAGLCSAALSSVSSDLNCIGACVTSDFYERFVKDASDRARLIVGKTTILVAGLATIGMALWLSYREGGIMDFTLDLTAYVGSIIGGGLLGMFLLGFFTRRTTKGGMYFALVVSALFSVWAMLSAKTDIAMPIEYTWHIWWLPGLSNMLTLVVGYLASALIFRGAMCPPELTVFHRQARARAAARDQ